MQKVESTLENKLKQKEIVTHSSSTVFWGFANKNFDTRISFLNHFLLKREIPSVSMRLSLRTMNGELLLEVIENINQPKVYSYSLVQLLEQTNLSEGEFAIYIEFTSAKNLAVPFCAVTSEIISQTTLDLVHTYGRALECDEFGSRIDFKTSYEIGWGIWNFGPKFQNYCIFHNGRLHSNTSFELSIFKNGNFIKNLQHINKEFNPFSTLRICLEDVLIEQEEYTLFEEISSSDPGSFDIKIKISNINSTFPRLLFISSKHLDNNNPVGINNIDKINITHSNFDFDKAEQPPSKNNYGFIVNPKYPIGIKSGFRYYPCKDLEKIKIQNQHDNTLPFEINDDSFLKVDSKNSIPSRLVGSNWSIWNTKNFFKDCSTGTFINEYQINSGFWHWGRLQPKGQNINSIISIINPFAEDNSIHHFLVKIYNESGEIFKNEITFTGKAYYIDFRDNSDLLNNNGGWYTVTGEGIGRFNVFSTCFFNNLEDGTIEHAF